METHSLMFWSTRKMAERAAQSWPRAYAVEFLNGWTLYRTRFDGLPQDPPTLTAACVCGDFH